MREVYDDYFDMSWFDRRSIIALCKFACFQWDFNNVSLGYFVRESGGWFFDGHYDGTFA